MHSEVRITEIMTNNVSTVVSDKYNYDGYVEFYNDGGNVDLRGWTITNMKNDKLNWSVELKSSHVLPNGYSLLFFGDEETSSSSATQVKYNYVGSVGKKLSTDGGEIKLTKDGQELKLSYPKQYPHISYCEDGFMIPTPGTQNDRLMTTISNRVASPAFKGNMPGLYENKLNVEIECETEGAQIYYTLNGDTPTPEKGMRYNGSISIEKTTAVRARAYKDGMLYSEILTGSYILPDKYFTNSECKGTGERLPIVSIVANNEDFFDDMLGIYVEGKNGTVGDCYTTPYNFNQDWMRSANFEYILNGKVVDNQEVEVGVYGGCTRIYIGKSLKIKANKRSGANKFQYDNFLTEREYKKYKSLALRNGGNGYSYVQPRWRDMFIQSLADGMNIDAQKAQPVAYYLNGVYYGMMILTERTNEDFVYHNYGLDDDEIDFISLDGDYICTSGTKEAYDKMINYVSKNYSSDDFYDKLDEMMDIDEYLNYQIVEQYVANTDWVRNNTKLWRKHDGGKFRWILFDTDFGLSKATTVDKDMIHYATTESGYDSWILLKSCLMNEDFRWRFLDQYLDAIENQFADERIDTKLDSIWDMTRLDMCATIKNSGLLECPGNLSDFNEAVENMRTFAKTRKSHVIDQLKKEFGLGNDKVTVKVRPVFPNSEKPDFKFRLNKKEISSLKYDTWRYSGERVKVEVDVPAGYKIKEWEINNVLVITDGKHYNGNDLTAVAKDNELKFSVYFEYDDSYTEPSDLYLNEICASNQALVNENGEFSDWIEIYNGGDKDVDLAGMVVENVTKSVKCTIPYGFNTTVVKSHGYKLLWADKKPELGPLHLNFKLGQIASETLTLSAFYRDNKIVLDSVTYEAHGMNESYGHASDGSSEMTTFESCKDVDGTIIYTSTPLAANNKVSCGASSVEQTMMPKQGVQTYVVGNTIVLQNIARGSLVEVITPLGSTIAKRIADSDVIELPVPTSGIFIVRVGSECMKIIVE